MKHLYSLILSLLIICSCGQDDPMAAQNQNNNLWAIPSDQVFDGGPGKDGIPSIDNPQFSSISEINFLEDNDLVVGLVVNGEVKAYPHKILDWHEIVNDEIADKHIALTYCPLTGTAIAWNRKLSQGITEFGVSGKLYNTNLIPYDRLTDSYWSQIGLNCINGTLLNSTIQILPVIETTWLTWKSMYPNSKILNTNTNFNRNYQTYPYSDYRTNHNNIIFPVDPFDDRLPAKERVIGVIDLMGSKTYSLENFETPKIIYDQTGGKNIIVIGSKIHNILVAYENSVGSMDFEIDLTNLPVVAKSENAKLHVDGTVIYNDGTADQLNGLNSFIGYWLSFGAFYPDIDIY